MPDQKNDQEIEIKFGAFVADPSSGMPVIILRTAKEQVVPIWIDGQQYGLISAEILDQRFPRPFTHDLLRNLMRTFGYTIKKAVIKDYEENTYYADLVLEHLENGSEIIIDCRPSDAIIMAYKFSCPIFATQALLHHLKLTEIESEKVNAEHLRRLLESYNADDLPHA